MSETITFSVEKREGLGKGHNRRLRNEGNVPGVFYSVAGENVAVKMGERELIKLYKQAGRTSIVDLSIDGGKAVPCLIWKLERHPFKNRIQHVDFYGIDQEKELRLQIPVLFTGTSKGVKVGGRLEEYRNRITVQGKPADIPASVTVDVTELDFNDSVRVAEVELPEGVVAYYDVNYALVGCAAPRGHKEEETEAEEA